MKKRLKKNVTNSEYFRLPQMNSDLTFQELQQTTPEKYAQSMAGPFPESEHQQPYASDGDYQDVENNYAPPDRPKYDWPPMPSFEFPMYPGWEPEVKKELPAEFYDIWIEDCHCTNYTKSYRFYSTYPVVLGPWLDPPTTPVTIIWPTASRNTGLIRLKLPEFGTYRIRAVLQKGRKRVPVECVVFHSCSDNVCYQEFAVYSIGPVGNIFVVVWDPISDTKVIGPCLSTDPAYVAFLAGLTVWDQKDLVLKPKRDEDFALIMRQDEDEVSLFGSTYQNADRDQNTFGMTYTSPKVINSVATFVYGDTVDTATNHQTAYDGTGVMTRTFDIKTFGDVGFGAAPVVVSRPRSGWQTAKVGSYGQEEHFHYQISGYCTMVRNLGDENRNGPYNQTIRYHYILKGVFNTELGTFDESVDIIYPAWSYWGWTVYR